MTDSGQSSFDFRKFTDAVAEAVAEAARKAKGVTTTAANDHRDKLHEMVDKAAAVVDDKTQGKYSDKVAKAKGAAHSGFDKVADAAPARTEQGDRAGSPFPADHEAPANDPRTDTAFPLDLDAPHAGGPASDSRRPGEGHADPKR